MFLDKIRVVVRAGTGGNGAVAFSRTPGKNRPQLPSGGHGGRGGDVRIVASDRVHSLSVRPIVVAGHGGRGKGGRINGSAGADAIIQVPLGVSVFEQSDSSLVVDLDKTDQSVTLAYGGAGGKGNSRTAEATDGQPGQSRNLVLELKTIADIGLVGFPNAGKSSLLRMISRATPKVASYPFTTLTPHVGVTSDKIRVADIPGLVEDAHLNRGLGHEFLRHVERTKALLFVLDVTGAHWKHGDVIQEEPLLLSDVLSILRTEVTLYNSEMASKPWGVVCNKVDLEVELESVDRLAAELKSTDGCRGVVATSAKLGVGKSGVIELMKKIVR